MKQTVNINLNGIVFHIDNDAYETLKGYLYTIEKTVSPEEKDDVMPDIEARIGELFTNMLRKNGIQVVNENMVNQVMEQLGSPEAFADEDGEADKGQRIKDEGQKTTTKRLYRDTDNDLLGGVCSGLAAYFGIDAVWIRLLFVFFTIVYGAALFLYILLWIIVPAAHTAAQRLEMRGVEPSVSNIEQEVKRSKEEEPSNKGCLRSSVSLLLKGFVGICLLFTVPVLLFALFIIVVVLFTLIAALFGTIPAIATSFPFLAEISTQGNALWVLLFLIFSLAIILIPVIMLIHWLITHFRRHEVVSKRFWVITGILWLISLLGTGVMSVHAVQHHFDIASLATSEIYDDDDDYAPITHFNELDAFHAIVVQGHADIDITQNPMQTVAMQTTRPDLYEVEVRDSVLYITCKEERHHPIDVDFSIGVPEIRSIISSGACSIDSRGVLTVNQLYVQASGAAEIDLHVQTQKLILQNSGASDVELKGHTDQLQINLSGAGEIDAFGLQARTANVVCSGAGKVEVFATETLSAQASGASKITYRGNPTVEKSITGGMSIIRRSR